MKYPVNVAPHMTTIDATKQQSFSFDFYGDDLCGIECYLYDAVTNQPITTYYGFGRYDKSTIIEEETSNILNMQRCGYDFGQYGTSSWYLENNRKYKYYLMLSQSKINQFLFQGGIVGLTSNNKCLLVLANTLLHPPREYSNDFITFGYYLVMEIGNERRKITNCFNNGDSNYQIFLDEPFNIQPTIGTQYRIYCNYIKSPEYTFKTKKDPSLEILTLDKSFMSGGGSAWFCKYEQEDDVKIKSYNWTILDESISNKELYSGLVLRPTTNYEYVMKEVEINQSLITKANTKYLINDYNKIEELDISNSDDFYIQLVWTDIVNSSALANDSGTIVSIYGSVEHLKDDDSVNGYIELNKNQFSIKNDSSIDLPIKYVGGFTKSAVDEDGIEQTITIEYHNALGNLIASITITPSEISTNCCRIEVQDVSECNTNNINLCLVEISDISQELIDENLSIIVQDTQYVGFANDVNRVYYIEENQELNIIWTKKEKISITEDENYSNGFTYKSKTLYIDKGLTNVIGNNLYVNDYQLENTTREIIGYDSTSGIVTLNFGYYKYPSENATYHIIQGQDSTLIQTDNFYKINTFYRCNYLAIDKYLTGIIEIRTEEDTIFNLRKTINFPNSQKDENGNSINVLGYLDEDNNLIPENEILENSKQIKTYYDNSNSTFILNYRFKNGIITNSQKVFIYREEENRNQIDLVHMQLINEKADLDKVLYYIDYLVANNIKYRYYIILEIKSTGDTTGDIEYQYYKYVSDWYSNNNNSWTISGLSKKEDTMCGKDKFEIHDTWQLYADIDSGDIIQNINVTTYNTYSKYPQIGKIDNNYISGSLNAKLGIIDCNNDDYIDDINRVNAWRTFITKYDSYILRSDKGDIWHIAISDNPTTNYDESNNLYTTISFSFVEIGDIHNIYIEQ